VPGQRSHRSLQRVDLSLVTSAINSNETLGRLRASMSAIAMCGTYQSHRVVQPIGI